MVVKTRRSEAACRSMGEWEAEGAGVEGGAEGA